MSVALAPRVLADVLVVRRPSALPRYAVDALLIASASLLVAACARVSIPLPFTPVPVTGQTFAVLLAGMLLGPRRGALALLLYLLEGAAGLPVFAGGAAGAAKLAGPTGGYLLSYPLAAWVVGRLAERGWDRRPLTTFAATLIGSVFVLGIGSVWLGLFTGGVGHGFLLGALPFLPGDAVKAALAAGLLPGAWRLLGRLSTR